MDRGEALEVWVCPASWGCNPSLLPFVSNSGDSILIYCLCSFAPRHPSFISGAENLQREYLSAIEAIEGVVEIVDAELIEDQEYALLGRKPVDRVKTLLGKLDSMRRSKEQGYSVSEEIRDTSNGWFQQAHVSRDLLKTIVMCFFIIYSQHRD